MSTNPTDCENGARRRRFTPIAATVVNASVVSPSTSRVVAATPRVQQRGGGGAEQAQAGPWRRDGGGNYGRVVWLCCPLSTSSSLTVVFNVLKPPSRPPALSPIRPLTRPAFRSPAISLALSPLARGPYGTSVFACIPAYHMARRPVPRDR